MGRRELGDYSGKFNRKRESSFFDASTGVSAFLFLKKCGIAGTVALSWCIVTLTLKISLVTIEHFRRREAYRKSRICAKLHTSEE
jgi:hypothetical protein